MPHWVELKNVELSIMLKSGKNIYVVVWSDTTPSFSIVLIYAFEKMSNVNLTVL